MTDAQRNMRTAICYGGPLHGRTIVTPKDMMQFIGSWPTGGKPCQVYELQRWRFWDGVTICVWFLNGMHVDEGILHRFLMMNRRTEKPLDAKTDQG